MAQHPHLIIPTTAEPSRFTSPSSGPRERMNLPTRSRAEHAQNLISKLEALSPQAAARAGEQRALGLDDGLGIYLAFESEPNFDVKFESLDLVQVVLNFAMSKLFPITRCRPPFLFRTASLNYS
jgi:hypothetical protein